MNQPVTCFLKYEIDPSKVDQFEEYARIWMSLVDNFGGQHHGYFLPNESANDLAVALFTFPSLRAYEEYRYASMNDKTCIAAYEFARRSDCIRRYDRQFLRPVMKGEVSCG